MMNVTLKNILWAFTGRFSVKFVQFAFSIVLARLLCPADFGLVGMLAIFTGIADVFMDCGLTAALIRKQDRTEIDYSTVLWGKIAVALLLYLALFLLSPVIAAFYQQPRLTNITRVVALGLLFVAVTSVMHARLQIAGRFRCIAITSFISFFCSGLVGVACTYFGFGVWAVVLQGLSWQVINLIVMVVATHWLPQIAFSKVSYLDFFNFGWKHLARGLLGTVYGNIYSVVIGKGFGAADLGFYNRANYYTSEIGSMVGGVVNEVNYPLLSQLQNDAANLRCSYRRLQALVASVMIPGMAVFAIFARPIIRLIIGEQWVACVPYLQVLSIGAAFSPLVNLANTMLYVKGRTDLALKIELVTKPIGFALLLVAMPFGILALCVANSATIVLSFVITGLAARYE